MIDLEKLLEWLQLQKQTQYQPYINRGPNDSTGQSLEDIMWNRNPALMKQLAQQSSNVNMIQPQSEQEILLDVIRRRKMMEKAPKPYL